MSIFDSIEPLYSVSGFGVGFLIGMTEMGGGSLMTPQSPRTVEVISLGSAKGLTTRSEAP